MAPAPHPGEPRARHIRVLLLETSGIVTGLIRQVLSEEADIQIVATVPALGDLDVASGAAEIDLVITTYADTQQLRILAIEDDGRRASMYTPIPERRELGMLTPETLIEFIRAAREST